MTVSSTDEAWMRQAIQLSTQSLYITAPNPRVGCLIVRDGRLLASGATQAAGEPHAEIMALRDAQRQGVDVAGATIYVSLEPCSHHGRTPPCVEALIQARPARVVIGMKDPNPKVGGQGLARLRAAGIAVHAGVCADQALEVNPGFVARMTRGTPWTWLKTAASLDGKAALHNGRSQWITGPQARTDGHHWRARSCVVLTGIGTIEADDPLLNVREVPTPRQPVRAIVDTQFRIRESARIFDGSPVWIFTGRADSAKADRLAERNVRVIELPMRDKQVDLSQLMLWLGRNEINEVHVEAGPVLSGALLQAGCADELLLYMAPMVLGDARDMYRLPELTSLDQALRFEFFDTAALGHDVRLRARLPQRWRQLSLAVVSS